MKDIGNLKMHIVVIRDGIRYSFVNVLIAKQTHTHTHTHIHLRAHAQTYTLTHGRNTKYSTNECSAALSNDNTIHRL